MQMLSIHNLSLGQLLLVITDIVGYTKKRNIECGEYPEVRVRITLDYGEINDGLYPLNCWNVLRAFSLQHKDERCLNANV